jgi:2-methylcitrate dehydratase PrpD
MKNAYKAYPCGIVLAPVIDAALALAAEHDLTADRVAEVEVRGNPLLLARADRPKVVDDRVSKLSLHHCVAIAIVHRKAGVREFSEPVIFEPAIDALRRRVKAVVDERCPVEAAIVTVRTTEGATHTQRIDQALGSLERPLSDRDLERKVRDLAELGGRGVDVDRLIDAVWSLDRSADVGQLLAFAGGGGVD